MSFAKVCPCCKLLSLSRVDTFRVRVKSECIDYNMFSVTVSNHYGAHLPLNLLSRTDVPFMNILIKNHVKLVFNLDFKLYK